MRGHQSSASHQLSPIATVFRNSRRPEYCNGASGLQEVSGRAIMLVTPKPIRTAPKFWNCQDTRMTGCCAKRFRFGASGFKANLESSKVCICTFRAQCYSSNRIRVRVFSFQWFCLIYLGTGSASSSQSQCTSFYHVGSPHT